MILADLPHLRHCLSSRNCLVIVAKRERSRKVNGEGALVSLSVSKTTPASTPSWQGVPRLKVRKGLQAQAVKVH